VNPGTRRIGLAAVGTGVALLIIRIPLVPPDPPRAPFRLPIDAGEAQDVTGTVHNDEGRSRAQAALAPYITQRDHLADRIANDMVAAIAKPGTDDTIRRLMREANDQRAGLAKLAKEVEASFGCRVDQTIRKTG